MAILVRRIHSNQCDGEGSEGGGRGFEWDNCNNSNSNNDNNNFYVGGGGEFAEHPGLVTSVLVEALLTMEQTGGMVQGVGQAKYLYEGKKQRN